jgi:four helix bundle protein
LICINNNIDDGFEQSGIKEFLQYIWFSKACAGEYRAQFYRVFDTEIIDENQFND